MKPLMFPQTICEVIPDFAVRFGYAESLLDNEFPYIARRIALMWGSQEVVDYIENDLIHHTPSKQRPMRAGFSQAVMKELLNIVAVHAELFPGIKSGLMLRTMDKYTW